MPERKKTSRIIRQPSSPCVGRERELRRLTKRFEDAAKAGEWVVLVQGPAGVGKTRLLEEFRSRVRLEGAVVVEGRCSPGMRALAPLSQILHQALDFLEQVGRATDVDVSRFAALLGDAPSSTAQPRGMTPLEQRRQLFDAYYRLLRDISRIKPLAVLVHDLHWADQASVELIARLADGAGHWLDRRSDDQGFAGLVVASARSEEEPAALEQLACHPRVELMSLTGFDDEGLRAYLQSSHVVERLLGATHGNPETLEDLIDSAGFVSMRASRGRVEALDPPSRKALAALSALGQPSEASLVARAAGLKSPARVLATLIDEGLVAKSIQGREIVLSLARSRFGELAYEWLDEGEQKALHSRIAHLLSGATGLAAEELAAHAIQAEEGELAVAAALDAASALELHFAFEAAAELLEAAAPFASGAEREEIDGSLSRLAEHLGDFDRALEHSRALAAARPDDGAAHLRVARLQALAGEPDEAARAIDEVASASLDGGDADMAAQVTLARAEVLRGRGREQLAGGDLAAARATFDELLALASDHDLDAVAVSALNNLGIARLRARELAEAEESFEAALELSRRLGSLRHSAIALESLAVVAHLRGDYGRALECSKAAVSELKRYGDRALLARAACHLAGLYFGLGQTERAGSLCSFAEQMAGGEPPPELAVDVLVLRGRLAMARGDRTGAREVLSRAAMSTSDHRPSRAAEVELALARLDLLDGRVGEARRRIADLRAAGGLHQAELGALAMVEADIEEATSSESLRPALVAVDHYERARDLQGAWRAHLRVALLLADKGDDDGHLRHLERASALESELAATLPTEILEELAADEQRQTLRRALAERSARGGGAGAPEAPAEEPPVLRPTVRQEEPHGAPARQDLGIIWKSESMGKVLDLVRRVAPTETLVLVRGDSGTGKELIAEAIHSQSSRKDEALVKVNCGAFVETLLMSELFGHEKGAFTGALRRREGRFEAADGGTLFLDEIGDISPATQVSLLRVLQEQRFERVGGSKSIETNARLVFATNRDLESLVAEGAFRQDLYYRLKGIEIRIPPLRERPDDIEALVEHFLARACGEHGMTELALSADGVALLRRYDWPGNVRELENVIRTVTTFVDGPQVTAEDLTRHARLGEAPVAASPPAAPAAAPSGGAEPVGAVDAMSRQVLDSSMSLGEAKKLLEREAAQAALDRTGGNITKAAKILGLTRPRLSQLVKELKLSKG